jgi:hypothetical protein
MSAARLSSRHEFVYPALRMAADDAADDVVEFGCLWDSRAK